MINRGDIFKFTKLTEDDLKLLPNSHNLAIKISSKYYFRDQKCINGHKFVYYTNGGCALCYFDRYYKNNNLRKKERLENLHKIIKIFIEFQIKKDVKKYSKELNKFPKSIKEAIKLGLRTYFTGEPCIARGHFCEKYFTEHAKKPDQYLGTCVLCSKNWQSNNKDIILTSQRNYHNRNRENRNLKSRTRRRKPEFKLKRNLQRKERYHTDMNYQIEQRLRTRMKKLLQGINNSESTKKLVGCDMNFLKKFLEKKFKKGMSWENYHLWHIDHIIPCSFFDLTDPVQQKKCFNYKNLQPLWANENLSKGGTNRINFSVRSASPNETKK